MNLEKLKRLLMYAYIEAKATVAYIWRKCQNK